MAFTETTIDVTRGALRLLDQLDMAGVTELSLANGRRADIAGLGPKGEIWIVEVKSCLADYQSDGKWHEYRAFCDRFFFAVNADFPQDVLPGDTGLIIADGFGGALVRRAPEHRLAGARRKAVTLKLARLAARRTLPIETPVLARMA